MCINQSDLVERKNQTQLMCEIYSRASYVTVWLGDSYFVRLRMSRAINDIDLNREARKFSLIATSQLEIQTPGVNARLNNNNNTKEKLPKTPHIITKCYTASVTSQAYISHRIQIKSHHITSHKQFKR
ncbi:hypothetical protein DL95DRAFT_493272 [Leptodontidium sp. 2 PMI_412]|nr:hypothetical protein DL95DRAFT_493272 [Leptodontidium sp. 2 PMI_412]